MKDLNPVPEDKLARIRLNTRVVSPRKRKPLKSLKSDPGGILLRDKGLDDSSEDTLSLSRSATFLDFDKQMMSTDPQRSQHHAFLRRMSSVNLTKSYTMPDLFDSVRPKDIYEDNLLRRNVRENLVKKRLHTTQNVNVHPLSNSRNKLDTLQEVFMQNPSFADPHHSKVTEEEKKLVADSRRKSMEESGLWQLASAQLFKMKAQKTNSIEDHAMAVFTRKVAINKMRQRIERKLDLPKDHFSRVATLRSNVQHIERRYRNIVQGSSTEASGSTHIYALQRFDVEDESNRDPKFMKPGEALQFFRRYARIVLIILKWIELIMDSSEGNKLERELKSFVDIANEVSCENVSRTMDEYGLSFDKNYFVARKEISLTQDHRKTLTTRWNFRTPEMIKQVMHGLQALRSLSEYPLVTQEKLCQVAWYQTLGPKKAIVRQGHDAESFYFILAGTAFVKKMMTDPKTGETRLNTVARLTRGMSFGEIGLIFNTKRTATVESATSMELLVIGKDDFNRIFMNDNDEEESEHVKFLRQVPIMQNWPIDCLREEPGTCILHYFKRGTLVSDDGKKSEWLYFIKSGSCEVLKKLKSVKARKSSQIKRKPDPITEIVLPELGGGPESKVDSGQRRRKHKIYMNTDVFQDMANYYEALRRKLAKEDTDKLCDEELHLPPLSSNPHSNLVTVPEAEIEEDIESLNNNKKESDLPNGTTEDKIFCIPPVGCRSPFSDISESRFMAGPNIRYQTHFIMPTSAMLKKEEPPKKREGLEEDDTSKNHNVFVKLALLQSKDVFGLDTLTGWGSEDLDDMLNASPATCMVSKGAEIVMLSKKVFLKYINDNVRNNLRESIRAYPREQKLQENFQNKLDWEDYKSSLISNVLHNHAETYTPSVHV
ncbi:uncharacterized protein LOC133173402 isoform X1 [Saccostrea echinata]|uniref:uncharacterized protein LOC133173402 isoform X1 n=1 Tax=Saccostrea echinata TaxID=191078 RepID=UPI002A7F4878|nr:uncharacterized protein LOC133173402 isoform X1 [Saccostrea echinata]